MLDQMVDEFAHEGKDSRVVGRGCEDELVVAECIGYRFGHIASGEIVYDDVGCARILEFFGKGEHRLFGIAVNGGVGDHDALFFGLIARPCIVKIEVVAEVFGKNGTVERADLFNIKTCGFFQKRLYLCAVFADDADVIASCFVCPRLVSVESAEFSEAVCGEENLILAVVGHDDLGPVNHRSRYKGQCMLAERKCVTLTDHDSLICEIRAEEVLHHGERFCGRNDGCVRICLHEIHDVRGMVGLHVLNDEIIGCFTAERILNVVEPFVGEICIYRIHNGDFFICNDVGVVGHSMGNLVLTFKKIDLFVVYTDVKNIICDFHIVASCYIFDSCSIVL